ncbi:MAG: hypothetical protein WC924_05905 [Candidatus Gracilibacteria bacterium]
MKYIDAIKGSSVALVVFIVLSAVIPGGSQISSVETILTISTFLFAILAGFFISRLNQRYNDIRELISLEDAYLLSLYRTAKIFGQKFTDSIVEKIDKYYLISFDSEITNYYKQTAPCLEEIYEALYAIKEKSGDNTYASMITTLSLIEEKRNKNSVISQERIRKSQWAVLILLTVIILFCLFYINTHLFSSQFLLVMLSTIQVLVLFTIRDLQNLRLGGGIMPVMESGQEVLESMGKLRYYNQKLVKQGGMEIPKHVKTYRLGLHNPGETMKIKIVKG